MTKKFYGVFPDLFKSLREEYSDQVIMSADDIIHKVIQNCALDKHLFQMEDMEDFELSPVEIQDILDLGGAVLIGLSELMVNLQDKVEVIQPIPEEEETQEIDIEETEEELIKEFEKMLLEETKIPEFVKKDFQDWKKTNRAVAANIAGAFIQP